MTHIKENKLCKIMNYDYHEIYPNLFLGAKDYDGSLLESLEINVIVCVAPEDQVPTFIDERVLFLRFPISFQQPDALSRDNMRFATKTCIDLLKAEKRIYLHCVEGYNRSAAVAVLVMMSVLDMNEEESIRYINKVRKIAPERHLRLLVII
jgi:protein-tyrosine phosphatase